MALTKQTKLARKRMNLIRSAQQRMFRQLRFTFTTSWCPTLYSGEEKETTPPTSCFSFAQTWSFLSLAGAVEDWAGPRLKPCTPLTHMLVGLSLKQQRPAWGVVTFQISHFTDDKLFHPSWSNSESAYQAYLHWSRHFCEKSESMTQKSGRQSVWVCYC